MNCWQMRQKRAGGRWAKQTKRALRGARVRCALRFAFASSQLTQGRRSAAPLPGAGSRSTGRLRGRAVAVAAKATRRGEECAALCALPQVSALMGGAQPPPSALGHKAQGRGDGGPWQWRREQPGEGGGRALSKAAHRLERALKGSAQPPPAALGHTEHERGDGGPWQRRREHPGEGGGRALSKAAHRLERALEGGAQPPPSALGHTAPCGGVGGRPDRPRAVRLECACTCAAWPSTLVPRGRTSGDRQPIAALVAKRRAEATENGRVAARPEKSRALTQPLIRGAAGPSHLWHANDVSKTNVATEGESKRNERSNTFELSNTRSNDQRSMFVSSGRGRLPLGAASRQRLRERP
jgi:hypothetical protein